ncbi:MAG: molybdopterin converting factor subunit 1 [Gammaproteobacteria bacterium]
MTTVRVLFFASLREATGCPECRVELADQADQADLRAALSAQLGADAIAALYAPNVRLALNQTLVEGTFQLRSHDEVAFLPPVTGG